MEELTSTGILKGTMTPKPIEELRLTVVSNGYIVSGNYNVNKRVFMTIDEALAYMKIILG